MKPPMWNRSRKAPQGRGGAAGRISLAAFGKHPGWDDHFYDLGSSTGFISAVEGLLYNQGIKGNIDAGAWKKLEPSQRLDAFDHLFVWKAADDLIVGRMWSSQDAKGRAEFPMVVCAHCSNLPLKRVVADMVPRLESLKQQCIQAQTAGEVESIIRSAGRDIQAQAAAAEAGAAGGFGGFANVTAAMQGDEKRRDLLRVLYHISQHMKAYAPGQAFERDQMRAPSHVRLPVDDIPDALFSWLEFMRTQVDAASPILAIAPQSGLWVDVVVGEPTPEQLFCLRASSETIPPASNVPYSIDEFKEEADKVLGAGGPRSILNAAAPAPAAAFAREPPRPSRPPVKAQAMMDAISTRRKVLPIIAAVIAAVVIVLTIVFIVMQKAPPAGELTPEQVEVTHRHWSELCDADYDWFATFSVEIKKSGLIIDDPFLVRNVMRPILDGKTVFNPLEIVGKPGASLEALRRSPPIELQNRTVAQKVEQALNSVRSIRSALVETWPVVRNLRDAAATADAAGWKTQAQNLRKLADSTDPLNTPGRTLAAANELLKLEAQIEQIDRQWRVVKAVMDRSSEIEDSVIGGFPQLVIDSASTAVAEAPAGTIGRALADIKPFAEVAERIDADLDELWDKLLDKECFREKCSVYEDFAQTQTLTLAMLEQWHLQARDSAYHFDDAANTYNDRAWLNQWNAARNSIAGDFQRLKKLEQYLDNRKLGDFEKKLAAMDAAVAEQRKLRCSPCRNFAAQAAEDMSDLQALQRIISARLDFLNEELPPPSPVGEIAGIADEIERDLKFYEDSTKRREWSDRLAGIRRSIGQAPELPWVQAYGAHLLAATERLREETKKLRDDVPPPPRVWEPLCSEYLAWFGAFHQKLTESDTSRWKADAHLVACVLKPVIESKTVFDPRALAGDPGAAIENLRENPPAAVKAQDAKLMAAAREALDTMRMVKDSLTAAKWPLLQQFDAAAKSCGKHGWKTLALNMHTLAKQANPASGRAESVAAIDALLSAANKLKAFDSNWERIEAFERDVARAGGMDPLVARFAEAVQAGEPEAASSQQPVEMMEAAAARLEQAAQIAEQLKQAVKDFWTDSLDKECFKASAPVHNDFRKEGKATLALLSRWCKEVAQPEYRFSDAANPYNDPGWQAQWRQVLAEAGESIAAVQELEARLPEADRQAARLEARLAQLPPLLEAGLRIRCCLAAKPAMDERAVADIARARETRTAAGERAAHLRKPPETIDPRRAIHDLQTMLDLLDDGPKKDECRQALSSVKKQLEQGEPDFLRLPWINANSAHIEQKMLAVKAKLDAIEIFPTVDPRKAAPALLAEVRKQAEALKAELNDALGAGRYSAELDSIERRDFWKLDWDAADGGRTRIAVVRGYAEAISGIRSVQGAVAARQAVVGKLLASKPGVKSEAMAGLWRRWCGAQLAEGGIIDAQSLQTAAEKLNREMNDFFATLPRELPAGWRPRTWKEAEANAAVERKLEGILGGDVAWTDGSPDLEALRTRYEKWLAAAGKLAQDAAELEAMLDQGYAPHERREQDNLSLATLQQGMAAAEARLDFEDFIGPVVRRAKAVAELVNQADEQLVSTISKGDDIALAVNAYRALGSRAGRPWPNTPAQNETDADLARIVREAAAQHVADAKRAAALEEQIVAERARRWLVCLTATVDAGDSRQIENLLPTARALQLPEKQTLPPWAKYNIAAFDLRRKLAEFEKSAAASEPQAHVKLLADFRHQVVAFATDIRTLQKDITGRKQVNQFADALNTLLEWSPDQSNVAKAGPASVKEMRWTQTDAEGTDAAYTWGKHTLLFRRIEPPGGSPAPFYLCAEEMTLGLYIDVVNQSQQRYKLPDEFKTSRWDGPRGWMPRGEKLQLNDDWLLGALSIGLQQPYVEGFSPGRPSAKHPMQYVSPQAAADFAKLIGCRLPAADEWRAAFLATKAATQAARWNLRDGTWLKQLNYAAKQRAEGLRPDRGIFTTVEETGKPVTQEEDKYIMFLTTRQDLSDSRHPFHHIVGNVAEIVVIDERADRFGVTGASALSPPELWDGAARPFDTVYEANSTKGYADVGFRLAFTAPRAGLADVTRRSLEIMPYISAHNAAP